MQFRQNDFHLFVTRWVYFYPVNAVVRSVGMAMPNSKIPSVHIRLMRLKCAIHIHATRQSARIFGLHVGSVLGAHCVQPSRPSIFKMKRLFNRHLEIHLANSDCAFAMERATAWLALLLNSESPPQPDSPSSSSDGSRSEMSRVLPVSLSK